MWRAVLSSFWFENFSLSGRRRRSSTWLSLRHVSDISIFHHSKRAQRSSSSYWLAVKCRAEKVGGSMTSSVTLPTAELTPLNSFLPVWLRASATNRASSLGGCSPAATDLIHSACVDESVLLVWSKKPNKYCRRRKTMSWGLYAATYAFESGWPDFNEFCLGVVLGSSGLALWWFQIIVGSSGWFSKVLLASRWLLCDFKWIWELVLDNSG